MITPLIFVKSNQRKRPKQQVSTPGQQWPVVPVFLAATKILLALSGSDGVW
jgi:hypothetical protein